MPLALTPAAGFAIVAMAVVWFVIERTRFGALVKAGAPVDGVIDQLVPLLEPGDIVIDAGNSHYEDTRRREAALAGARTGRPLRSTSMMGHWQRPRAGGREASESQVQVTVATRD